MAEAKKRARERPAAPAEEDPGPEHRDHVCTVGFCPICLAVTAVQPLRPEAVDHLVNAGREFLLAMSSILGARAEDREEKEPKATLTRIDIE
jgi:hypothetical protein